MKTSKPVTRTVLGIVALAIIAILANWLISLTPLGNRGADFTQNKVHTLSDGTRSILGELDSPVVIRYYASRSTDYMPEELKLYMRRVDDMLKEYASLSKGKLRIENLDPKPDTDAEDSANLDGITAQQGGSEPIYLGIAVSCLDRTSILPFLDPGDETLLEYHLSKLVADVSTPSKPTVGVMSALDLQGSPGMMGQQGNPGWVIYEQLQQSYDVQKIDMAAPEIDPNKIKVLLVFHPAEITPDAEYAIDQYLLKGGTVIACVDPFSVSVQITQPGNPMMGGGGAPTASTLPTLLGAWGVEMSDKVLADPTYATKMSATTSSIAVLTLPQEAMPQADSVITKDLGSIAFFLPGGFTNKGAAGISYTSLARTTRNAGFVDSFKASRLDPTLERTFKSSNTAYDLVVHLSGKFKTAFANGKPKPPADKSKPEAPAAKDDSLKEAAAPGNVFLVSDVDSFYDRFSYSVQNFGTMKMATPINANSTFFFNLIDQAVGSKYLIGSRSRTPIRRPFTVIQKMEADFNKSVGAKIEEFQAKQQAAQQKLTDLQAQKSKANELYLSPEQEAEIKKLRAEQVEYARLIREQEKELRRRKDALGARITVLNVAVMPALVILVGLGLYVKRRRSTRAR